MKALLIVIPYDNIYPPMNGGMLRCFHILNQLAKYYWVTAIINQEKQSFLAAAMDYPALATTVIYSTKDEPGPKDFFSFLPTRLSNAFRFRWYKKSISETTDSNFLLYYPILKRLLKQQKIDGIILENLNTLNAVSIIRSLNKTVPIIYDAHNVDSSLARVAYLKGTTTFKSMGSILKNEQTLFKSVNSIVACSKNDLDYLLSINKGQLGGEVIPNGVEYFPEVKNDGILEEIPGYILFCGTLNSDPNCEGLLWFFTDIWSRLKNVFPMLKLLIVGSGDIPVTLQTLASDPGIIFTGPVVNVKPYYERAVCAIVPLKTGSGTRLKVLEAMNLGLPVISTSIGAEGIAYEDGINISIADKASDFGDEVIKICRSKEKRITMQQNARKLIKEKYDWNTIGLSLHKFVEKIIKESEV